MARTAGGIGNAIGSIGGRALSAYFRRFPITAGKQWVWDNVARPYVGWRPIRVRATTRTGLKLDGTLSDTVHNAIYFFGVWEPALTRLMADTLRPGDVFVDVGANVGVHSMAAAQLVGPTGRVHSVEASPTIAWILRANVARNGLANVTVRNVAVADAAGTVDIFVNGSGNLGGSTIMAAQADQENGRHESVPAMPLRDVVPADDLARARMIKIDVEGAEWLVLKGMEDTLATLRPDVMIIVEVNRQALAEQGATERDFMAAFRRHGYEGRRLADHSASLCISGASGTTEPLPTTFEVADVVFQRPQP